jgi:bacterioferritin-associated ferredoxin
LRGFFRLLNTINYHLHVSSRLTALLHPARTMIVCVCHRVSDQTIARCARSGMAFDDIQLELGVATQCGQCESCARSLWSECTPHQSVVHLQLHPAALPAQAAAV